MIITLVLKLVVYLLDKLFFFFPYVTELPFGIDSVLSTFMGYVKAIIYVLPFFESVWQVFILSLSIKYFLWIYPYLRWIVNLFRGSGS